MIDPIETSAPLVGSVMQLLAHARFIVNYVTLLFHLQITKLVDNLQLKYAFKKFTYSAGVTHNN